MSFFYKGFKTYGYFYFYWKTVKKVKDPAASDDLLQWNGSNDFDHFDILPTNISKFRLLVKENLLINVKIQP